MTEGKSGSFTEDPESLLDLLGNNYRRHILRLLSSRRLYPQQLSEILGITPSAVIKHLRMLEEANVVKKVEQERETGGRPIQLYWVDRNLSFSFEMFNPTFFRIEEVSPERGLHDSLMQSKIKTRDDQIAKDFAEVLQLHNKLREIEQQRLECLKRREFLLQQLRDFLADNISVVNVFRVMVELSNEQSFTRQDLERMNNLSAEDSRKILQSWDRLGLIEVSTDKDKFDPEIRFKIP